MEYRDVIGSLRYAKSRSDTKGMTTAMLSVCLGANSSIVAMKKYPEEFAHIRAMIAFQPVMAGVFVEVAMERADIPNGAVSFGPPSPPRR